ncbi:MAG: hypothetical protein M1274_15095 [Actinobacteria bacterium]|nr:hypothetical protein [Actinomycetota bacterium]
MPIVFTVVDHDQPYLEAVASGQVTADEVRAHLLDECRARALSYPELIDACTATPDWSSREARDIVDVMKILGEESTLGPTAVVVSTDYAFGMIRMLEILLDGSCILRPFRSCEEARHWLSRPG